VHGPSTWSVIDSLPGFIAKFASDMASFYDADARELGWTAGVDRSGNAQRVPLLSVSCGCAIILADSVSVNLDALSSLLADLKKQAKTSPDKIALDYAGTQPSHAGF
jgi:hypothetical protein